MAKRIWWIALIALLVVAAILVVIIVQRRVTPSGTPTPSASPPTSSVSSPSPSPSDTESAAEKQKREAFAAAEKALRSFQAEYDRLANEGGTATLPNSFTAVTAGPMLKSFGDSLKNLRRAGWRQVGANAIVSVVPLSYSRMELKLETCSDGTGVTIRDRNDVIQARGQIGKSEVTMRRD